jgi:hypothetical protein
MTFSALLIRFTAALTLLSEELEGKATACPSASDLLSCTELFFPSEDDFP